MRSAALLLVLVLPLCADATPAGISGFSGKGGSSICTSCHTGGAAPTVALTGPASLVAGMTGSYTVTVTGGPAVTAGLDAALSGVNSGSATFTAGPGTKLLNGEVVHSAAKTFAAGNASFTFSVKAPLTAGVFTLTVAGLSSNNNNDPSGDGAVSQALNVNVILTSSAPPSGSPDAGSVPGPVFDAGSGTTPPVGSTPPPAVSPAADGGTTTAADAGTKPKDLVPAGNGNHYNPQPQSVGVVEGESGCTSSGGMPMGVLAALIAGALLNRSRRALLAVPKK